MNSCVQYKVSTSWLLFDLSLPLFDCLYITCTNIYYNLLSFIIITCDDAHLPELYKTVGNIDAERAKEKKENGDEVVKEESKKKEEGDDDKKSKVDRNAPILPQLQEKFSAAQSYGLDKVNFSLFSSTYSVLEGITFLLLGVSFCMYVRWFEGLM